MLLVLAVALPAGAQRPKPQPAKPQPAESQPAKSQPPAASVDAQVAAIVGAEREKWGVMAARFETGEVVCSLNPSTLFLPASNEKSLTTAAVLDALGPSWTTRTSVYAARKPDSDGVVRGDLVLYGRGDPNLSGRFSESKDPLEPLRGLASLVRAAGVTRVEGGLVADESYLSGPPHGSGWAFEDIQWHFGAEVSALSFSDNLAEIRIVPGAKAGDPCTVTVEPDVGYVAVTNETKTIAGGAPKILVHRDIDSNRVDVGGTLRAGSAGWTGEIAVVKPALYTAAAFRRALADAGVQVSGPTRRLAAYADRPPELELDGLVELASIQSRPLGEMIKVVNKQSQNLHAELLLRLLGRERGPKELASDEAGAKAVAAFLERIGAAPPGLRIHDGCGLSRMDRLTPGTLTGVMAAMGRHQFLAAYSDSLPAAGVDGTLKNRLRGFSLRAKTGSLDVAKSLSGYLVTKSGQRLVIAIVYNDWSGTGDGIGKIDRIVAALAAR